MTGMPFAVPGMFVPAERYVRIEATADDPEAVAGDFAGLWVEVRSSLTNGELANLREQLLAIHRRQQECFDIAMQEARVLDQRYAELAGQEGRDAERIANRRQANRLMHDVASQIEALQLQRPRLLAPYIRAWNLYRVTERGYEPAPPPAEAGPDAFDALPAPALAWLERVVLTAYREGKAVTRPSPPLNGLPAPTSASSVTTPSVNGEDSP